MLELDLSKIVIPEDKEKLMIYAKNIEDELLKQYLKQIIRKNKLKNII